MTYSVETSWKAAIALQDNPLNAHDLIDWDRSSGRAFDWEAEKERVEANQALSDNSAIRAEMRSQDMAGLTAGNLVADADQLLDSLSYLPEADAQAILEALQGNPDRSQDANYCSTFDFEGSRFEIDDGVIIEEIGPVIEDTHWQDVGQYSTSHCLVTETDGVTEEDTYIGLATLAEGPVVITHGASKSSSISTHNGIVPAIERTHVETTIRDTSPMMELEITCYSGGDSRRVFNLKKWERKTARALKSRAYHGIEFVLDTKGRVRSKLPKTTKHERAQVHLDTANPLAAKARKNSKLARLAAKYS
jgi:hypothetical protein